MNDLKKIIFLTVLAGFTFFVSAEKLLSFPLLYPVENAMRFNKTSRYMSGVRYSWVFSAYLPEHVQKIVGKWHLQGGASWFHKIQVLTSYSPAVASVGVNWELHQLHYVRPVLGLGYAFYNPLDYSALRNHSFLDKKSYFITAGLLFSFDILDSNFSNRMNYEYSIHDMGLFVEYQKYDSLEPTGRSHWGVNTGFFLAF